ncbi:MAG: hypothetical protein Q4A21_01220 [bacterium]|nr:hypothetical protein [bacterium]
MAAEYGTGVLRKVIDDCEYYISTPQSHWYGLEIQYRPKENSVEVYANHPETDEFLFRREKLISIKAHDDVIEGMVSKTASVSKTEIDDIYDKIVNMFRIEAFS